MRGPLTTALFAAVMALGACGDGLPDADVPIGMELAGDDCPVHLGGVDRVTVQDTPEGATLVFTGQDPELPVRAAHLASVLQVQSALTGDEPADVATEQPRMGPSDHAGTTAAGTVTPGSAQPGVEPSAGSLPDAMPSRDAGSMGQEGGTVGAGHRMTTPLGVLPPGGERTPGTELDADASSEDRMHAFLHRFPTVWGAAEPVQGGAALVLRAREDATPAEVQRHAHLMAEQIQRGGCPLWAASEAG